MTPRPGIYLIMPVQYSALFPSPPFDTLQSHRILPPTHTLYLHVGAIKRLAHPG